MYLLHLKEDLKKTLMRQVLVALHGMLSSGAYGASGCRSLSEGEMSAWISRPEIAALLRGAVDDWMRDVSPGTLRRWDHGDVEMALLEGAVWMAVIAAVRV
jgi:hypothetical protein